MAELKYFAKIRTAQAATAREPAAPLPPFDLAGRATKHRLAQWFSRFLFRRVMPAAFAILRWLAPNFKIGRLIIVTRDADVREVLGRPDVFQVPFALEMTELAGGTNSVLGLEGAEHERLRNAIRAELRPGDLADIRAWSRGYANALIEGSAGRLDVVGDLITRVAAETCCRYFGLTVQEPDAFAQWTIAASSLLFADPTGDPEIRRLALNGAARVRAVIEDSIARVRANDAEHPNSRRPRATLIDRFIDQGVLSDRQIVATIMGLATGFIPTNTLAAGNMLEELLATPAMLAEAEAAASKGDEAALRQILLRAACRNPALSPGQWRFAAEDTEIAPGTRRRRKVPSGSIILAAIASALRDPAGVYAQDSDPEKQAALIFGDGVHSCLGAQVAMEQIVQTFLALLKQPNLKPAGKHGWMQRVGVFPFRFDMTFDAVAATQTMIIVCAPVRDGATTKAIETELDRLGNPARDDVAASLTRTGLVHFASLSVIEGVPGNAGSGILLFEINADGTRAQALRKMAEEGLPWLAPIFAHANPQGRAPANADELFAVLENNAKDLHCYPWGPIGIHYNGTGEFSVQDIARQEALAEFARKALRHFFHDNLGRNTRAMEALTRVRRFIKQDSFYQLRSSWRALLDDSRKFEFSVVRPTRRRLAIADWNAPQSTLAPLLALARSADGLIIFGLIAALWLAASALGFNIFAPIPKSILGWAGSALLAAIGGAAITAVAIIVLAGAATLYLLHHEIRDPVDERPAEFDRVRELVAREDHPGYQQNHIMAVMPLKPGPFRRLVFAFALWGIKQSIIHWFRPGFVVTMGTIHYAKWFRVPGTGQFVFMSNYDGSWESYLEDFVTRAHWGQSAAWSNGVGFPRTRLLIFDGAADGDRFKRWVRRQQRPTRFWYSRFPKLTTKQIRANALIEDGLARAASDTDARRWLACFGSAQREEESLETAEVQSIVFGGFGNMYYATGLVFRLPATLAGRRRWLQEISGLTERHVDRKLAATEIAAEGMLPRSMRVSFGDHPIQDGAAVLGLSARGLAELGLDEPQIGGLAGFATAFRLGMAQRGRLLGDNEDGPAWHWSDAQDGADGILMVYGQLDAAAAARGGEAEAHAGLVAKQVSLLERHGGRILHTVPTGPLADETGNPTLKREHFGFRDGISQPVIRGTQRAAEPLPARDLIEPGEFILGYRNDQRYFAPPITVAEDSDRHDDLPSVTAAMAERFPRFGNPAGTGARDFGRNGTFLVVRQLDQNVADFWDSVDDHVGELARRYPHLADVYGRAIDREWVAAKFVGRWQDGTPLVGNPNRPSRRGQGADNDFAYGIDDPQGLQCPLGAHVRRANPRDSMEPGDAAEQRITNRHRLLRRGRSYNYDADGSGPCKGLLFMALCADIERQFEFVQHTWLAAPSFHGLSNEIDPLAGHAPAKAGEATASFTIPTASGPVTLEGLQSYVTARAGGYFFLPSRAALSYLATFQSLRDPAIPPRADF